MRNELYPIFLKASQLNILIVGGGKVALEKLTFLLKSSPNANVLVLSVEFDKAIIELSKTKTFTQVKAPYSKLALKNKQIVIAATNNKVVNKQIYNDAKAKNVLINVADTPDLCDFYLGSIVTKGALKMAISTNGTSPTLAKRLRQLFEEILPDEIAELTQNLSTYRRKWKPDFKEKVSHINRLTKKLINQKSL